MKQRRFAGTVASDDAYRFARRDTKGDIAQCPEFTEELALAMEHLPKAIARLVEDLKALADAVDDDR
uniref:hypothetical protein n=1 Tax=Caballeronia calidae TaxID=1777139 RepID=UPI0035B53BDC